MCETDAKKALGVYNIMKKAVVVSFGNCLSPPLLPDSTLTFLGIKFKLKCISTELIRKNNVLMIVPKNLEPTSVPYVCLFFYQHRKLFFN